MKNVNIVFQVIDHEENNPTWADSTIVLVLTNAHPSLSVDSFLDTLGEEYPGRTIRFARLPVEVEITVKNANRYNGGYYQCCSKPQETPEV
jgi:hypothetical protein